MMTQKCAGVCKRAKSRSFFPASQWGKGYGRCTECLKASNKRYRVRSITGLSGRDTWHRSNQEILAHEKPIS